MDRRALKATDAETNNGTYGHWRHAASTLRHASRILEQIQDAQAGVKPCGHCGAKPRIFGKRGDGYYVACVVTNCRQAQTCCHKTRQGAVDEWNEETV